MIISCAAFDGKQVFKVRVENHPLLTISFKKHLFGTFYNDNIKQLVCLTKDSHSKVDTTS